MKKIVKLILLTALVVTLVLASTSCDVIMSMLNQGGADNSGPCKHVFAKETVEPTCTEQGYDIETCKLCGDYRYSNYVKATGHTASDWIVDIEVAENVSGERHKECTVCHEILEKEGIEPHKHDFVSVPALAPTCTTPGYNSYEYCTLCDRTMFEEIPALDHDYSAWTSLGNSTHSRTCANDTTHVDIESCSGGEVNGDGLAVCEICGVEYAFVARLGNSSYGYYALGEYSNGSQLQKLYASMRDTCEEFLHSTENVTADENGYFIIGTYDFGELSLTTDEARGVWKIFCMDNPSYYWLSNVILTRGDEIYLAIDADYAKYADRVDCDTEIAERIAECATFITDDMSDLEVAMTIVSYIVSSMEYAYDSNGQPENDIWAHNLVGFASMGCGVCESYAKTFMHLCLLNGVECIIGSGYGITNVETGSAEKHAWNYIFIDGEWYGADVTWTDNSGDEAVFDNFGIDDGEFHATHILNSSDDFGIEFTYEIPMISDTSLELCELLENGTSLGVYTSIEDAFAAMVDPSKEYEIKLGYYSFFLGAPEYTIDITELPRAHKITITGVNKSNGEGYLDSNTLVRFRGNVKLNSDLELKNLKLEGTGIVQLNKHEMTTCGACVYLNVKISGNTEGSSVNVTTEHGTYFNNGANVYRINAVGTDVIFGAESHIVYLKGDQVYTSGGAKLEIENREK